MNKRTTLHKIYKMERSYESAIELLNSRRRQGRPNSNRTTNINELLPWNQMPGLSGTQNLRGKPSLAGMKEWLQLLGHSDAQLDRLNVIHVAGTKGKGSTCAFTESLLQTLKNRTGFPRKIGLYTSPHLIRTEERIRIDSKPISPAIFAKYVFEVWDCLSSHSLEKEDGIDGIPRYLQLLALVSFHTFIREDVGVAIYETHHGGEYDATNVIQSPIATGVTNIGMDHVDQLGPDIENIAWHKAGIFKSGSPAFSVLQGPAVTAVLQERAVEKGVSLEFVRVNPILPATSLVLTPEVQKTNCSLALALVQAFLEQKAPKEHSSLTSSDVHKGIEHFNWPGRFQRIIDGNCQWFLDGAHNELSAAVVAGWFAETATTLQSNASAVTRILIFSQISDQRDGALVLKRLAESLKEHRIHMQNVIFTTYKERRGDVVQYGKKRETSSELDIQKMYDGIWEKIDAVAKISYEETVEDALQHAKRIGKRNNGMQTLVTGSLYLVGSVLALLNSTHLAPLTTNSYS